MNKRKFEMYIEKSEFLRDGYINSLESADLTWEEKLKEIIPDVPQLFIEIYSRCDGTNSQIKNQKFFDFLPGYRLMQVFEILEKYKELNEFYAAEYNLELIIPFLSDYGGNFIVYTIKGDNKYIASLTPVEGIVGMYDNVSKFWNTIISCYDNKVYFLDEDDYLSYDSVKELEISKQNNPNSHFWNLDGI